MAKNRFSNTTPESAKRMAGGNTSAKDFTMLKPIRIPATANTPPCRYAVRASTFFTEMWFFFMNHTHSASIASMNTPEAICSAFISLP